jgi:hypothetical protein
MWRLLYLTLLGALDAGLLRTTQDALMVLIAARPVSSHDAMHTTRVTSHASAAPQIQGALGQPRGECL